MKLDIRSDFDSLSHATVRETLARLIKDRRVLDLTARILRGPDTEPDSGVGLPIGSLTSQWFANLVLDRLDHLVTETLRVPSYARSMDDFVLFADHRPMLASAYGEVAAFVRDTLGLGLKERATILAPVSQGLPFLGWQVFPGLLRPRPANLRRYLSRLRQRRFEVARGRCTPASYRAAVASIHALLRHGNTHRLRVALWAADTDDGDLTS